MLTQPKIKASVHIAERELVMHQLVRDVEQHLQEAGNPVAATQEQHLLPQVVVPVGLLISISALLEAEAALDQCALPTQSRMMRMANRNQSI